MGSCQSNSKDQAVKHSRSQKIKSQLIIKTSTWPKDSHGLFDYEAKNMTKKDIISSVAGRITRTGHDVNFIRNSALPDDNANLRASDALAETDLVEVTRKGEEFWVQECASTNKEVKEGETKAVDSGLWIVVNSLRTKNSNKGHKLQENDTIKFGRAKFKVKETRYNKAAPITSKKTVDIDEEENGSRFIDEYRKSRKASVSEKYNAKGNVEQEDCVNNDSSQVLCCRVCLSEDAETDNPFVSLCLCTGTMKLVHLKCLQHWLKSKMHTKQSTSTISYFWKSFECELCKTTYPSDFIKDGKKYELAEIPKPDSPYVVLEMLTKDKKISKGLHVINFASKNCISIGRGHDSDVRIPDISVSRCHGFIKYDKTGFYLEDNNSKFGTLVQMEKPLQLPDDSREVMIQCGRSVLSLSVKKIKGKKFGCLRGTSPMDDVSVYESPQDINTGRTHEQVHPNNQSPHQQQNHQDDSDEDELEVAEELQLENAEPIFHRQIRNSQPFTANHILP